MGGKDISDKIKAAYNPEQNYLALQSRPVYQAQPIKTRTYLRFDYYQHRRN
jgi:hypothetical protein